MRDERPARGGAPLPLLLLLTLLVGVAIGVVVGHFVGGPGAPDGPAPASAQVSAAPSPGASPSPAAAPVPPPTSPPDRPYPDRAYELLDGMSQREKICQLLVVYPEDVTGVERATAAGAATQEALEQYPVGGFLYQKKNMERREQLQTMISNVQSFAKLPLLITCDEEGGRVARLMDTVGVTAVGPMLDFKDEGGGTARANARTIAADMAALGFNADFAPVADVWSNPDNTVIGDRAYSDDFQQAAELLPAAVQGFHDGGVACCLKHFPGHGDTSADSHYGSVYVRKSLAELREQELLPFQAGIDAGADMVMAGHLIVSDVDSEPAPFSHALITGLLREEMGFQGVVITDGLRMQAMTDHYTSAQIAVKAVAAGVDMLLCPDDLDGAVAALTQAVDGGELTQDRLDESVLRVLTLKLNRGIVA